MAEHQHRECDKKLFALSFVVDMILSTTVRLLVVKWNMKKKY